MKNRLHFFTCRLKTSVQVAFLISSIFLFCINGAYAQDILWGLTPFGGTQAGGTIFSMSSTGTEYTVHKSFGQPPSHPEASLVQGNDGWYYGTTSSGGSNGMGTVFKINADGSSLIVLKNFSTRGEAFPHGNLIQGSDDFFYGTTQGGGEDDEYGTVFKINADGTSFSVIKYFSETDGANPYGGLILGNDGYLYGMTQSGGSNYAGTVFKIDETGSSFTVLKNFNYSDGSSPFGNLLQGSDGLLYGMTNGGGLYQQGVVFKINVDGSGFEVLKHLNETEGAFPVESLVQGSDGYLYGITTSGGRHDNGTIFKINTDGTSFSVLKDFNSAEGRSSASLLLASDGYFYGTTRSDNSSTLFRLNPDGSGYTTLKSLNSSEGPIPSNTLIEGSDGALYGTATYGDNDLGSVSKLSKDGSNITFLTRFSSTDGLNPYDDLIQGDDGAFYGITSTGGEFNNGVIFRLSEDGTTYSVLRSFREHEGMRSFNGLIQGSDGFLYGMSTQGGADENGTIFKIRPDGTNFSVIRQLNTEDGIRPLGSLTQGSDGYLYGTASSGGTNDYGTVFRLKPEGSDFKVLNHFSYSDGAYPSASLLIGNDGDLYGVTARGGYYSEGSIFKMKTDGTGFTLLWSFDSNDGARPTGNLIQGIDGHLYGTAYEGNRGDYGSIFRIHTDGSGFTVLKAFNPADGTNPHGGLQQGSDGFLYGTTSLGGSNSRGTIYKISPDGTGYTVIRSLEVADGTNPRSSLVIQKSPCALQPVTVPSLTPALSAKVGSSVSAMATTTDNNLQSANWNWGDGTITTAIVNGQHITGSHVYTTPGLYTVSLTVSNTCGQTVSSDAEPIAIYDPELGFITGGGWFNSPPGAYSTRPVTTGKAHYAFVAKYLKGSTVPTGNTLIKLPDLFFKSTSFDWLVVTGAHALLQGSGTINGTGSYGFLLSVTDGHLPGAGGTDKIRVMIWDKNAADALVYDSQPGDATAALATQAIGGGSIVIHLKKTSNTKPQGKDTQITAYPNPVRDIVTLHLGNIPADSVETLLMDASGQTRLENAHRVSGPSSVEVDMTRLRKGIYSMQIRTAQTVVVIKLLKQ
jgi:uncharacterized repeat protein (TIGR03803 family)